MAVIVERTIRIHADLGESTAFEKLVEEVDNELDASLHAVVDHMREKFSQCQTELVEI